MCDVYVTPYLNEAQMTSGTLAYSFGLGQGGRVDAVLARAGTARRRARHPGAVRRFRCDRRRDRRLLTDEALREAMRVRAYASSRSMTWERTAKRYLAAFETARRGRLLSVVAGAAQAAPLPQIIAPAEMRTGHFLSMCDDTGLFQHAVHSVPDRAHGYCVDDNARALLLACVLNSAGEPACRKR
jgi:hypothetical protein